MGLEITIPVKVEENGKVAVPAGVITNFLNNFNDDKLIIEDIYIGLEYNTTKFPGAYEGQTGRNILANNLQLSYEGSNCIKIKNILIPFINENI